MMLGISFFRFVSFHHRFAKQLGFASIEAMRKETFRVFHVPPDAHWYATRMPGGGWAAWTDQGSPPFETVRFDSWQETIGYLHRLFESKGYTRECWQPEGFGEGEDVFEGPPSRRAPSDS